jgi:hypothetical protein
MSKEKETLKNTFNEIIKNIEKFPEPEQTILFQALQEVLDNFEQEKL